MPIHLLGTSAGDAPFNRSFFNTTLGEVIGGNGKATPRVTLFLVDGTTLDVCSIEGLTEQYATIRVYHGSGDTCPTNLHLIPYGTIYRIEINPSEGEKGQRVGFHWTPARER